MPLSFFARKIVVCLGLMVATPILVFGQVGFSPEGGEFAIAGTLPGDQVKPSVSVNSSGGYVVWEDNVTDGNGQGISARRLNGSLSGSLNVFRVNSQGAGDQENPEVIVLDDGGAVFVWQGGITGKKQIYAQFYSSSGISLTTNDVLVNSIASTNNDHLDASITKLSNGNVVITWSSWNQDGSMQGVFAQIFSPAGTKIGGEFQVAQTTLLNQRTPVAAGLSDGSFMIAWVSEAQVSDLSFDVSVFARRFNSAGTPVGNEFKVNTGTNVCANPSIAASPSGGFFVAWGEKDISVEDNSWDVFGRAFSSGGSGGVVQRLNTMQYGDQIGPKVASSGSYYLVVWTSLRQDGSWEGVYGQFLKNDGSFSGGEFRANTTVLNRQIHPTVASDGNSRFLVLWSSFMTGGINSFDLLAQRYADQSAVLPAPGAPFVTVLDSSSLGVTWPEVAGFNVANYEIYADGASTPTVILTNNWWTMTNLASASTHSFRLDYVLTDGRRSPLSAVATNTTYGALVYGGIPYDWMIQYFGGDIFDWPSPNADSDGDGVSNRNEFLAGTDPTDPNSVLRTRLEASPQGMFLIWNTQPGLMYQVQASSNLGGWLNMGGPRFAVGSTDSVNIGSGGSLVLYRILRLR